MTQQRRRYADAHRQPAEGQLDELFEIPDFDESFPLLTEPKPNEITILLLSNAAIDLEVAARTVAESSPESEAKCLEIACDRIGQVLASLEAAKEALVRRRVEIV